MNNLLRSAGIIIVLIIAALLLLAVGGVLTSSALWHNLAKVAEVVGILLGGSAAIMLIAKK